MLPSGHAAVGYLLASAFARVRGRRPSARSIGAVVIGAQLPDLVDKPLAWGLGTLPAGRSLGHSLFVLVPVGLAAVALARRCGGGTLVAACWLGTLSHALVDAVPALWGAQSSAFLAYPLLAVAVETGTPSILTLVVDSLTDPWGWVEALAVLSACWAWLRDSRPGLAALARLAEAGRDN